MNSTTISIVVVGLLIGGVILYARPNTSTTVAQNTTQAEPTTNVTTQEVTLQSDTANDATPPPPDTAVAAEAHVAPKAALAKPTALLAKQQVVEIMAKGGYTPKVSQAKADIPTILRMKTQSTYDCTSSINIPTLNIRKILPPDGVTDIPLPPQKLGTSLTVLCGMGMYNTVINFN